MKKYIKKGLSLAALSVITLQGYAGNPDRVGQAGATELLINSYGRSSGWGGVNNATIRGLESSQVNIAGIAHTGRTEIIFSRTNWLVPTGIGINSFGLSQRVGESGAFSLSFNSMSFGEIERTTVENPEGGIGTFSPRFLNLGLGYAKTFSRSISGGMQVKIINEAIEDVRASGFALDAGVQYVTSSKSTRKSVKKDDIHFGVSVRNVGPNMKFSGDGMSIKATIDGSSGSNTVENRVASFDLPSQVQIGAAYDFRLDSDTNLYNHKLTAAFNFVSNSYSRNNFIFGAEYSFKEFLMFRAGYVFEKGIFKELGPDGRQTALTGFCGGFSIDIPLSKNNNNRFGFDYSYRSTNPFNGIHTFGVRLNLADKD